MIKISAYFEIALIDKKEVYGLGTVSLASKNIPYFVEEFKGNNMCIWNDQDCSWCEDIYVYNMDNEDYGKPWGPEYFYKDEYYPKYNYDFKEITKDEFYNLFDKIKGDKNAGDLYEKVMSIYKSKL